MTASLTNGLRGVDGVRLWARAPLAPFTTIGTGGSADLLITTASAEALHTVLGSLERAAMPWTCLGAGSNLLVADSGYRGVLIKLGDDFQYLQGLPVAGQVDVGERVTLEVGAGTHMARLAAVVAESGLSGLEFCCGIPGSVGGGVLMNAGAHGGSLSDVVEAVRLVSAAGVGWVAADRLDWGYRHCGLPPGAVVTAVKLGLTAAEAETVVENQRSLLRERRKTQPRGVRTFGSVFKNPPGQSAGRLLDAAGAKGVHRGGAEVSTVHANFIVNHGDATTADILVLMGMMREGVQRMSGVSLEPEVRLLGTQFPWLSSPEGDDGADESRSGRMGSDG